MFKLFHADAKVKVRVKPARKTVPSSTRAAEPTAWEVMQQIREDVKRWDADVQQKLNKVA